MGSCSLEKPFLDRQQDGASGHKSSKHLSILCWNLDVVSRTKRRSRTLQKISSVPPGVFDAALPHCRLLGRTNNQRYIWLTNAVYRQQIMKK
ncbi:hypothetical protein Y032_0223g2652 [Ancylostoma ceylanicum]|uniref:Uncharacterized protein n=1 Tax=Ancylostoma ceylanicum TaxID=53326 RepID=A0A016SIH3_9BILA|nr:hypothetical protein Y032_0223g2652 [Ancylostoma ceylanicum]